jgi:hypothetical protein
MKKIGFIDYYLDEWHANNYPQMIKESPANKDGYAVAYAFGEIDAPKGLSTKDWCKKYGVEQCAAIEEVCEKSDCLIILSPDNSERHLELAQKALPCGKVTYIDKTFAPTLREARAIFDIAAKHRAPVCSSSALRFASEIEGWKGNAAGIATLGSGPSFETYGVHQIEMIVKALGTGAEKLMALQNTGNISLIIVYKDGRRALYTQPLNTNAPMAVSVEKKGKGGIDWKVIESNFFGRFIDSLLGYFATRKVLVKKEETLSVIALIEAGSKALKKPLEWVRVKDV